MLSAAAWLQRIRGFARRSTANLGNFWVELPSVDVRLVAQRSASG